MARKAPEEIIRFRRGNMVEIGKRCREMRLTSPDRCTQGDVAVYTGYSQQVVSSFEHGKLNNGILVDFYYRNFGGGERIED